MQNLSGDRPGSGTRVLSGDAAVLPLGAPPAAAPDRDGPAGRGRAAVEWVGSLPDPRGPPALVESPLPADATTVAHRAT